MKNIILVILATISLNQSVNAYETFPVELLTNTCNEMLEKELNLVIKSFKSRYKVVYELPEFIGDQYFNVNFFIAKRGAIKLDKISTYQFRYWTEDDQYEQCTRIEPQVEIY